MMLLLPGSLFRVYRLVHLCLFFGYIDHGGHRFCVWFSSGGVKAVGIPVICVTVARFHEICLILGLFLPHH